MQIRQTRKALTTVRKTSLSKSSQAWVRRQLQDPFVMQAQKEGYRARAVYKLLGIQEKFKVLKLGQVVVDLGCAPGSWAQIAAQVVGPKGLVLGIDLLPCEPLAGVTFLQDDFSTDAGLAAVQAALGGRPVDVVLCDMAANTVGHKETDGIRTQALSELAVDFVATHLSKGGHFVCKLFMNGYEAEAKKLLATRFTRCQLFKPAASRSESREIFLVGLGFKG